MNLALAINEPYLRYAYVMLTSVFENHKEEAVSVFLLHGGIAEEKLHIYDELAERYGQSIRCLAITEELFPKTLPSTEKWPLEIYYRLALPFLLSEERILYLDADIIVNRSLKPLYETELSGALLSACPDISDGNLSELQNQLFHNLMQEADFHYYNSGVLLMDLAGIRREFTLEALIGQVFTLKDLLSAFDQDLINYVFHGRILPQDASVYNHFARIGYLRGIGYEEIMAGNTAIVHYSGPKPWSAVNLRTNVEKLWWDYAKKTPFYRELLEELLYAEMDAGYRSTNEFRYQELLLTDVQNERDRLKKREQELLLVMEESRKLIEKLSGGGA